MSINEIRLQTPAGLQNNMAAKVAKNPEQEVKNEDVLVLPDKHDKDYREEITIKQAAKGLVGAGVGLVGDSIGMTGAVLRNMPKIVKNSYVALAKTEAIGRNLKVVTGAVGIPLAAALVTVLSPVAGAVYGAVKGAYDGAKKGIKGAAKGVVEDVKTVNRELKGEKLQELFDGIENAKPEEGK